MKAIVQDRELIRQLRGAGIRAKRWMSSGEYKPPADVNWLGELRVHTAGRPELLDVDAVRHQAVIRVTKGRYAGEDFLLGMDETSNFVTRLPRTVLSVSDAHEALRPTDVPEGSTRQGEWFFLPVADERCSRPGCGDSLSEAHHLIEKNRELELGSTHRAEEFIQCGSQQYARGIITDTRQGRHRPVDLLSVWHQVRRNTERKMLVEPERSTFRSYD